MLVINDSAFDENAYLIEIDGKNILIDPGYHYDKIKNKLANIKPDLILITHYHFDHVFSVNKFCEDYNIKAYIHENGKHLIQDSKLADTFGFKKPDIKAENILTFRNKIDELPSLTIIPAPGHSADSTLFMYKNMIFVGDVLFKKGHGRIDLPDSNKKDMVKTMEQMLNLKDDLEVFPGHGESFLLKSKKETLRFYTENLAN